ncbi:MAG: hypothetical protein VX223_04455, partial [Myxococcota bacterium]|nr:hypothetical protein [Myxococcota bacterium]
RISGVFLHPKHASLLVVVDRYSASEFNQVPIFIELESLSDFDTRIGPQGMTDTSTKRGIENQGPKPSSSRRADSASDAQEPTITVAGPAIENSAAPVVAGPEANQIGTPLDAESDTSRVWFMGSDILDESTICIGFSPDEKEALVVLRRFQKDRELQLVVQRLVADPAVPGHVLFSGTEEELRTEREAFKRLELQLGFQHVHSCIEGTRRTDRLWFVAYRGRPVLVEAAKEHLVLTAQSGQPRRVAPLVPGEVIAGVYQHTEKPMALVLLGVGSNSPLPHRAILVSLD